jgi:hypothetical protein
VLRVDIQFLHLLRDTTTDFGQDSADIGKEPRLSSRRNMRAEELVLACVLLASVTFEDTKWSRVEWEWGLPGPVTERIVSKKTAG